MNISRNIFAKKSKKIKKNKKEKSLKNLFSLDLALALRWYGLLHEVQKSVWHCIYIIEI